jgi:hypothetical protein
LEKSACPDRGFARTCANEVVDGSSNTIMVVEESVEPIAAAIFGWDPQLSTTFG